MASLVNRGLSLAIAIGYVVAFVLTQEPIAPRLFAMVPALLFTLALIWFPDACGEFTCSSFFGRSINATSPGCLVCAMGWFLLVGVPVILVSIR